MNADEARDKFADAAEGSLGAEREAFEAALAADAELKDEYELYQKLMRGTRALGNEDAPEAQPPPSFLPAVQRKIRIRSKGRYFRDRFSSESGTKNTMTLILAMAILLIVATTIAVVQSFALIELPGVGGE